MDWRVIGASGLEGVGVMRGEKQHNNQPEKGHHITIPLMDTNKLHC